MATRSNANKGVTGRNSNVPPPARNTQDNTQAIRRIPGMSYGEQQEIVEQQQAAPLPKDTTPQQPTQRRPFTPTNVFAPTFANSSTAIAVDGQPIPVDVTETERPLYTPVMVLYSLLSATNVAESKCSAMNSTLPGSPGNITKSDTSPVFSWTWY